LADLPWQGRVVELQVRVRRFRCTSLPCRRRIFAERLDIARPQARRTVRLRDIQQQIGLALGGEAGSRLAGRLAMPVSGDTLLRLVRTSGIVVSPPPRILGVDDWAWRRGQRYGTIICDLERRRVIDLLPDRTGETLASWLRQHGKDVAVVSRDRAGAYAEGIRVGAPQATQVADRWHLMVNASEALRRVLDRHFGALRRAARLRLPPAVMSSSAIGKQQAATQRTSNGRSGASSGRRAMTRWLGCIVRACRSAALRGAWASRATPCAAGYVLARRRYIAALWARVRSIGILGMWSNAGPRGATTVPSCGASCMIRGSMAGTTSSGGGPSGGAALMLPA